MEEYETLKMIIEELNDIDIDCYEVTKMGVVGVL